MNCKEYQQKVVESLAAGDALLPREVSVHRQTCAMCRNFYETQVALFRAMDSGLLAMVNQEIPPSLLPEVRAQLELQSVARRTWLASWSFAVAVAAGAILALSLSHVRYLPELQPNLPTSASLVAQSNRNPAPVEQPTPDLVPAAPNRTLKHFSPRTSAPAPSDAPPEVIVLAEERQGFARFVAELPREQEVALALTRPAPKEPDAPVEVALLQIQSVDVKPLDGTPSE